MPNMCSLVLCYVVQEGDPTSSSTLQARLGFVDTCTPLNAEIPHLALQRIHQPSLMFFQVEKTCLQVLIYKGLNSIAQLTF